MIDKIKKMVDDEIARRLGNIEVTIRCDVMNEIAGLRIVTEPGTKQETHFYSDTLITHEDETKTVKEWAKIKDIGLNTLRSRLNGYKWSTDKALETPVREKRR